MIIDFGLQIPILTKCDFNRTILVSDSSYNTLVPDGLFTASIYKISE